MRPVTRLLQLTTACALLAALPACSLLIPENPSAPRYNSVLGAPRSPQLNPARANSMSPTSSAAPRPTSAQLAMQGQFPQPEITARDNGVMAAPVDPVMARTMPNENAMVVAGRYPELNSVPPTPTDNAQARLEEVRRQLEADRYGAGQDASRLGADAAAQPSLLNTPGIVPPADPIYTAPAAPPIAPQSNNYMSLPPPPPPLNSANSPNWDRNIAPPMMTASAAHGVAQSAMEPIMLRPPSGQGMPVTQTTSSTPVFGYASPASPTQQTVAMGMPTSSGFNPMAGAEPINLRPPGPGGSNTSYLPASRYSTRR